MKRPAGLEVAGFFVARADVEQERPPPLRAAAFIVSAIDRSVVEILAGVGIAAVARRRRDPIQRIAPCYGCGSVPRSVRRPLENPDFNAMHLREVHP